MTEDRRELLDALGDLAARLDTCVAPEPPEALVEATFARARSWLRAPEAARAPLPPRFKRELGRLLAAIAAPSALMVAWNAFVLLRVPDWLARWIPTWLPEGLAWALPAAYVLGALGWMALVLGSLPFVAHRRASLRQPEVPG